MGSRLTAVPLTLREANDFIEQHHRHHTKVVGHRFTIGAQRGGKLVGAIVVGRAVARRTNQSTVAEVTRLVTDGTRNCCSFLYGRAADAAKAMGYTSIQTFTLPEEGGASLRAVGWANVARTAGGKWGRPSRTREPGKFPETTKWKWVKVLAERRRDGKDGF